VDRFGFLSENLCRFQQNKIQFGDAFLFLVTKNDRNVRGDEIKSKEIHHHSSKIKIKIENHVGFGVVCCPFF